MPVDQTGENILFVVEDGFVEAHVQIQYEGEADSFAWLVPVPALPEITVGSFQLLTNVLDATVPTYAFSDERQCGNDDGGGGGNDDGGAFIAQPDAGGNGWPEPPPEVLVTDTAGAFEFSVLQGGTADSVMTWLGDNGYVEDENATPILEEYLDEGMLFVAFKLRGGEGVEDIHPVVIRYEGDEPCIPLRLTRIAAKDDMDIRALFLGDARVVPTSYRHAEPNLVRLEWLRRAENYKELVTKAVDEAGGRAFVTEFAGASDVVDRFLLDPSGLDDAVFETIVPTGVVAELRAQGLLACTGGICTPMHDLVMSLLHEYLPVPPGVEEDDFYWCLECYGDLIDMDRWDGVAFAADFRERIIEPMAHARHLLETWPYLTRLYTTISPHEMIRDPMFREAPELGDVKSVRWAQRQVRCCGMEMDLPGGRSVGLDANWNWPIWTDEMPWSERIDQIVDDGPPQSVANNSMLIDTLVADWNATTPCNDDGSGDGSGDTGPGADDDGDPGAGDDGGTVPSRGCSCRTRGRAIDPSMLALGLLLPLWMHRRTGALAPQRRA